MSAAFNDYVLTTSAEQGWVTAEQVSQLKVLLGANPKMAALDLIEEQQLMAEENIRVLRDLIDQAAGGGESQDNSAVRAYLEIAIQTGASDLHHRLPIERKAEA